MTDSPSRQTEKSVADLRRMSLADHIQELRSRLIRAIVGVLLAAGACLYFGDEILGFIRQPLADALAEFGQPTDLKYLNPVEFFSLYIRVGLICGLMLASPWVLYQLWSFVAAGLYKRERKWVLIFAPASMGLFVAGLACMFYTVLPLTLRFFLRFGQGMATPWFTWGFYVSMVLSFSLGFGIGFQTPLAVIFLAVSRLVSLQQLRQIRKYVLIGILVLAAVLTPPDWQSQILLALPMAGLYELGLLASWLIMRERQERPETGP